MDSQSTNVDMRLKRRDALTDFSPLLPGFVNGSAFPTMPPLTRPATFQVTNFSAMSSFCLDRYAVFLMRLFLGYYLTHDMIPSARVLIDVNQIWLAGMKRNSHLFPKICIVFKQKLSPPPPVSSMGRTDMGSHRIFSYLSLNCPLLKQDLKL